LNQAVDQSVGVVAQWVFYGNCNEAYFYIFLQYLVFPAIAGQQRYIMSV
jgi:hypothetical protein